mgnify:CR=1 FL=1|jgi:hypothetical protein
MKLTKLTPAEWKKPNSAHPEKKDRIDILVDAINRGVTVQLVTGEEVQLAKVKSNIEAAQSFKRDQKAFNLTLKDGRMITSSDIGKSALFGGGKGAGGGSANTAIVESAQCVWLAAMLIHGIKDFDFYTDDVLKFAYKSTDVGKTSIDQILDISPEWKGSSYKSARGIIEAGYVKRNHKFHRDSATMKKIYAKKKEAFKNSGLPVMSDDKWNPGDIWAIADGVDLDKVLDTTDIMALNASLLKLFDTRKLIGISLKLVRKKAKLKDYNVDPSLLDSHKFIESSVSSNRGTFFSNKAAQIFASDGFKIQIQTQTFLGSLKMEILGKTARGGGAGWGQVMSYAKLKMGETIPDNKQLRDIAQKISKDTGKADALIKDFYRMAKSIDRSIGTEAAFTESLKSKDIGWIHSKYGCTAAAFACHKNKGRKADAFITSIINYAGSKAEESSVYVKVYE